MQVSHEWLNEFVDIDDIAPEEIAYNLINTPDVDLFSELVESEDFLFDFVKRNVAQRLEKCCNE